MLFQIINLSNISKRIEKVKINNGKNKKESLFCRNTKKQYKKIHTKKEFDENLLLYLLN